MLLEQKFKSIFKYPFIILNKSEWDVLLVKKSIVFPKRHREHFIKILKKSENFHVIIGNGQGKLAEANVNKNDLIISSSIEMVSQDTFMHLIQVPIKKKNLSLLVQKATEVGYKSITFINSKYNQNQNINIEKLNIVAENACMQSRNPYIPHISILKETVDLLTFEEHKEYIWGDWMLQSTQDFSNSNKKEFVFINGPEGGWSVKEESFLKSNFLSVKLSNNVLRAETAAICAGVFIQNASKW